MARSALRAAVAEAALVSAHALSRGA